MLRGSVNCQNIFLCISSRLFFFLHLCMGTILNSIMYILQSFPRLIAFQLPFHIISLQLISCSLTQLLLFQVSPNDCIDYMLFSDHSYCIVHACNATPSVAGNTFSIHDSFLVSSAPFNNTRLRLLVPFTFFKDTDPVTKPFGKYICTISISLPLSFVLDIANNIIVA